MNPANIFLDYNIINASVELTPTIRISPFDSSDLQPQKLTGNEVALAYLKSRFKKYYITVKARDALSLALRILEVNKDDTVTILTTSDNFYISSCVTSTIERFCKWNREVNEDTKVILVNHEFGYPNEELMKIKEYGYPIIEDCAHAFVSEDSKSLIGTVGDYVLYSLPKYFPMQVGAILAVNTLLDTDIEPSDNAIQNYVLQRLSVHIPHIPEMNKQRLSNYHYLVSQLAPLGISPYFELHVGVIPNVFLFKWDENIDFPLLKQYMQYNGVECSVFYGQSAFFIPCHHKLKKYHLDYMVSLIRYFSTHSLVANVSI